LKIQEKGNAPNNGEQCKCKRAKKDMTQQDLAKLIGVSRQIINSIEAGKYLPSTVLTLKISKVF
jgi:putative transcriptional regulator